VRLRFLAGYGITGLFGVGGFVLNLSINLQTFQACYAEVILHIHNHSCVATSYVAASIHVSEGEKYSNPI